MDAFATLPAATAKFLSLGINDLAESTSTDTRALDQFLASVERKELADETLQALDAQLAVLPARQRQAFLLRSFEGLDVAATARDMGCSAGSVKTHYFRAVQSLRSALGEFWS